MKKDRPLKKYFLFLAVLLLAYFVLTGLVTADGNSGRSLTGNQRRKVTLEGLKEYFYENFKFNMFTISPE
ncbi:MAG: hypothetical protein E7514_04115 [Ruminococcaceae bacterium]|nr:hypothetical protein [Oscillospiraceae bacterium]